MFPPLTDDLAHALTSRTHSEGITALAATLLINYHGRILLIENSDRDGADLERWDLPATTVYPGETLTVAIDRALATAYHGLELDEITGYVGSYDRETPCGSTLIRHFAFTTEIPDPTNVCRTLQRAHHWAGPLEGPALADDIQHMIDEYYTHRHSRAHPIVDLGIVR